MKAVQYFSDDYLARCREASAEDILQFLESFRLMQMPAGPSKLISLKVPEDLLNAFRQRCQLEGIKYQTCIKQLMRDYVE
jgi:predicted DNA binding CopG/RHH family protein